ncbi:hypothetical protein BN439_3228 [Erwinia amylovora Ea644]|nr:hypothetical protein BN439_3228 [Erwinia amylovora Ea644]CCP08331.1 hypothetical protein BN440_3327 [Erwinia amylovora MR1]
MLLIIRTHSSLSSLLFDGLVGVDGLKMVHHIQTKE